MLSRFHTVPTCYGQTDRQTDGQTELLLVYQYRASVCWRAIKTWVHYWDPGTKQESMQWKHQTSPAPIKFRIQPSAACRQNHGNCVLGLQWNSACGIHASQIHCHCRQWSLWEKQSKKNVLDYWLATWCYCMTMHLFEESRKKFRQLFWSVGFRRWTIHPTAQTWHPVITFCSVIWRSTCDFQVQVTHTHNQADVSSWLQGQDHNFFLDRISSLAAKWNKCIELEEDYVKNNKILVDLTILHDIQVDNFLAPLVSLLMTIYRVRQNKTPQHENRNALIFLHQTLFVCSTHNCPQIWCFMLYLLNLRWNDGNFNLKNEFFNWTTVDFFY